MPSRINIIGQRFGKLLVKDHAGFVVNTDQSKTYLSLCVCDCGNEKVIRNCNLGSTKSCGCFEKGTHGHTKNYKPSRTYKSWCLMISRCTRKNGDTFEYYAGREITVCQRWRESFEDFLKDMGERPPKMTIDRIKVNEGYFPGNCRWATQKEQTRNMRSNRMITFNGETMCLVDWGTKTGISFKNIHNRLKLGWPVGKALTEPVAKNGRKKPLPQVGACQEDQKALEGDVAQHGTEPK